VLFGVAIAGLPPARVQSAQPIGELTIRGTITNGTAGGAIPESRPVRVIALGAGDQIQGNWEATVDSDGSYAISGIPLMLEATYAVGIEYGNAAYVDRVEVLPGATEATRDLTIYEATMTDPGIRFEQSAVVLAAVDPERGTVEATEVHSITNPTDLTFVPSPQGPGGAAGLLVFGLPTGSTGLTPLMGLDPSQVIQIDRGFASLTPIYPGRTDLSFRYRFPYMGSTANFERTIRYPVESFRVLSSEAQVALSSPQLTESTRADIGGRSFQALGGGPFERGATVAISATGLPAQSTPFAFPLWTISAAGALAGLGIVAYAWRKSRTASAVVAPRDEEEIVDRLVALEQAYAGGQLAEADYRESRQSLIAAALTLAPGRERRSNGGHGVLTHPE
jgi:hypothetical protein